MPQLSSKSPEQYAEVACILLKRGADATVQDKDGMTPFHLAFQRVGIAEVKCFLGHSTESDVHDKTK